MPVLTDPGKLALLKTKLAEAPTSAEALNAPTKAGERIGNVEAAAAVASLSAATLAAIQDTALSATPSAAAAVAARNACIAWGEHLTMGQIALAPGSQGRAVVDALVTAEIMTQAERTALVALATVEVPGPSWAEANGFGFIYPENLHQVQEVDS
jgi:hypothetical protein